MAGESIAEHVDNLLGEEDARAEDNGTGEESRTVASDDQGADADGGAAQGSESGDRGHGEGADQPADGEGSDDDGYFADELDSEDEPDTQQQQKPNNLTDEQQYIVDNLAPIVVRGRTTPGGRIQDLRVYAPEQLPDTFEFASKREEVLAIRNFNNLERKAEQLQGQFRDQQQKQQFQQYSEQENADIRTDIADLQREGSLPRYKYTPNDRRFESDPAVQESQKILEFMNEANQEYVRQGKLYRISYRTAYDLYQREQARRQRTSRQGQEDSERKTVTRRMAGSASAPSTGLSKPRPARSMEELKARLDMLDF